MNKIIPSIVGITIVVGGISFYAGMHYAKNGSVGKSGFDSQANVNQGRFGQPGAGRGRAFGGGVSGGLTNGEIMSKDDKTITIKMRDGSSKIIFFSNATKIEKPAIAQVSDLVAGQQVMVMGDANSDGSLTAKSIQVREVVIGGSQSSTTPSAAK